MEDHGSGDETTSVRFDLAVSPYFKDAHVIASQMQYRVADEPHAGGAGEEIQHFLGRFGEVDHDLSKLLRTDPNCQGSHPRLKSWCKASMSSFAFGSQGSD
jgi:hypothetical protein